MKKIETVNEKIGQTITSINNICFAEQLSVCLKELIHFDNIIFIAYVKDKYPTVLYKEYTDPVVYRKMDSQYVTGAYLLDPFYHEYLKGASNGIKRLADVAPDRFRRTKYYKVYYEQTSLIDEIAIFVKLSGSVTVTVCLGTDRSSQKKLNKKEILRLFKYYPIFKSLIKAHWKSSFLVSDNNYTKLSLVEKIQHLLSEKEIMLTPRQAEVALLILKGHSTNSIALNLAISPQTVKVFRRQLYTKCNISSQSELFSLMIPIFYQMLNPLEDV